MEVLAPRVADRQPSAMGTPGHRALHDPAVAAQPGRVLDALARDADPDAAPRQAAAAAAHIVALVGVPLLWALAPPPVRLPDRRDGVDQHREDGRVRARGPGQARDQREPGPIDHTVALRARCAAIRRARAGRRAPLVPGRWRGPGWRGTSRSGRRRPPCPAGRGGVPARPPPPAKPGAAASRWTRCRSPAPAAGRPGASRSGARS